MRLVETTDPIRFAYIMTKKDSQIIFLVDSESPESPDYSSPGEIYKEDDGTLEQVFSTGETIISEPETDHWGTWISVIVPILNEDTGEVIAIFGIDYPAQEWSQNIWKKMIPDFIAVFMVLLLYISFLYIWAQRYRLNQLNKKLILDEALYRSVFEQAPIGIAIMKEKSHAISTGIGGMSVNPMYEKIVGRTKEELVHTTWMDMTYPDDLAEDVKKSEQFKSGEISGYSMEKRYLKPDGSIVWTYMKISTLLGLGDNNSMHLCLIEDVTLQKNTEKALKESERRGNVLVTHLPGLAYRCKYDQDGTMLLVSEGCFKLTGYEPEKFINNQELAFNDIIIPKYRNRLLAAWKKAINNHLPYQYEYEIITATGEKKWVIELGEGVYDSRGEIEFLEGIILDITERKKFEDNLQYVTEHNSLTGLYNRGYLEKMIEDDIKNNESEKKAIISINLSTVQFLTVNYGFHYTQNLIKKVAEELNVHSQSKRVLFQTYENRFAFYWKDYQDKNELIAFTNDISKILEKLFISERITSGLGVLEIDKNCDADVDLLLKRVLIASERSLNLFEEGFKTYFYDTEMEAIINRERQIKDELSLIADDNFEGKLYLQYQPILEVKSNSICAFEALARLKTATLGNVSPLEFIPIAEKTKLIIPIGEEVIRMSLQFLKKINERRDEKVSVSINISAIQLLKPDFVDRLFELIAEAEVSLENIALEITESIFASDYKDINNILSKLKEKGVHIAIDDFGTGYSSLSREKELNIDCLKIDKYFIDDLLLVTPEKSIIKDIISMAHKLGHCTIAEGVEEERQLQYLQEHGCDKIQGYFISKPLDKEIALQFIEKYKKRNN